MIWLSMQLTSREFAESFGEDVGDLHESVTSLIDLEKLNLCPLTPLDRDRLIIQIVEKIRADSQVIASGTRTDVWEKGWRENLDAFRENPLSDESLVPKFIRPNLPVRWFKEYYKSVSSNFELSYIEILRQHLIVKYFGDVENLYEFGAGTGFNLLHAHRVFPKLNLYGTDFVQSAVDLMNEIGTIRSIPLKSSIFNMLFPKAANMSLQPNSAVWTFGSLEQLGGQLTAMVDFLIENSPKICVHVEPAAEFYEEDSLPDYLAKWFQSKRGYSQGLLELLKSHEREGKIEVLKLQRLNFGSTMMEGYNLFVWRPLK